MASNSEVADCNQLNNSPFPSTCVEEAMVDAKLMKRSYSLKSVFSLSILGYWEVQHGGKNRSLK